MRKALLMVPAVLAATLMPSISEADLTRSRLYKWLVAEVSQQRSYCPVALGGRMNAIAGEQSLLER
jgi:hypothetical protein